MAYIPPSEFAIAPSNEETEATCGRCGYDLQGLPWNTRCPECGASSALIERKGRRYRDLPLSQMPRKFIKKLAVQSIIAALIFPIVATRVAFSVTSLQFGLFGLVRDTIIAGLWILAVTLLSRPINEPEAIHRGMGVDGRLRKLSWWCSFSGIGIAFTINMSTPYTNTMLITLLVVFLVGLFSFLLLLVEIADWVRDTRAKKFLNTAAWGPSMLLLLAIVSHFAYLPDVIVGLIVLLAIVFLLGSVFGMMFLASSILQSVHHARKFVEYQERRLKSKDSAHFPTPE